MNTNLTTITMVNKDCHVIYVETHKVVSYLFQGYSIIAGTLIDWSYIDTYVPSLPDDKIFNFYNIEAY